jgi:hypothetical protein
MSNERPGPWIGLLSEDEYRLKIKKRIDALRTRIDLPAYFASEKQQDKIRLYFLKRAYQVAEACFRVYDLETPLVVMRRVLCEDLFHLLWISLSEQNAAEYAKWPNSELIEVAYVNLKTGQAQLVHRTTGEDKTKELLPKMREKIQKRKPIKWIATECGLRAVYDLLYKFDSVEAHGKSFELIPRVRAIELSIVNALLNAIILIVDRPPQGVDVSEVLEKLGVKSGSD